MADTIDPNLTVVLNNNTKDRPRAQRDQLIPEEISHISGRMLTSIDKPDYSVARPEAIVVKTFSGNKPKVGSIPWTKRINLGEDTDIKPFAQCMVSVSDGQNIFTPQPSSITNVQGNDHDYISMTTLAYADTEDIVKRQLQPGDRVQIEYIDGIAEARIIAFIERGNVPEPDGSSNQQNDGSNLGDYNNNSTGDGTQSRNNIPIPDGKCGDGSSQYPEADCKTARLDSNGQTITLHPVYWCKINDLLNQIKTETGTSITVRESIRNKKNQLAIRKSRCPAAYDKLGEERFKTEPWSVILQNGPCLNKSPVGAVEGASASNHLKGLAVDFKMDVNCPAKNVNLANYERCRAISTVFNLLNRYAPTYGVINLISEPWHWSSNGG